MTTALLVCLYIAPVVLLFAGMAAVSDYLERRYDRD